MSMNDTMTDFKKGMGMMSTEASDTMKAFNGFMTEVLCDNVLDTKTKELIALGMAITARCAYCIGIHVGAARGLHPRRDYRSVQSRHPHGRWPRDDLHCRSEESAGHVRKRRSLIDVVGRATDRPTP